mgnify:FL=1
MSVVPEVEHLADLPEDGSWHFWKDGGQTLLARRIDARRYMAVMPLLYTHAIIWGYVSDEQQYEDRWCYHSADAAVVAATVWSGEGEPDGWHRHPFSGRRREDGDPAREYVSR